MSQWSRFRDYINSTEIGNDITRQEILLHVYKKRSAWTCYSRMTTVDNYRKALSRLEILTPVKRGVYNVAHHVREDISFQKIKDRAYGPIDWREWFIRLEDKQKGLIL
ncbi:MAG: hypothetical protein ACTSX1_11385 [Candidatus Heimdallarchaeaceae archaeon]